MREVRVHLTLFDEPPSDKQRAIAYLEVSALLPDDLDPRAYANQINARVWVEQEVPGNPQPSRFSVDLTPGVQA